MYICQFSVQQNRKGLFYAAFYMSLLLLFAPTAGATCGFSVEGVVAREATCGGSDGQATLVLRGGTAPFNYTWSNGTTAQTATGLAAGTYSVTVSDATACVQVQQVQISHLTAAQILNPSASSANCQTANGGFTFNLVGNGNYDIAWSGAASGTQTNVASPISIAALAAGNYNLTVTDANGCNRLSTFVVGQTGNIGVISTVIQAPNCGGGNNGILRATATSGTLPFEFFINGVSGGVVASNVFDFSALAAATYTIVVRDGNGCTTLPTVVSLSENGATPIAASSFTVSNSPCPAAFSGSIVENTPSATAYQVFNRQTGALVGNLPQNNTLAAGNYEIRLNTGGCISILPFTISDPAQWQLALEITNPTCTAGDADIVMTVTGGTPNAAAPNYTFAWSNGANTQNLTNVVPDFYRVSITDASGCTFVSSDILVTNCSSRDTVTVFTGANIVFCVDTNDIAGAVFSVVNLCPSSNNNGTINSIGVDGCIDYTAGTREGIDTICVEVCNAAGTSCDTTTIIVFIQSPTDTFRTILPINTTATLCPDISPLGTVVSAIDLACQPLTQGSIGNLNTANGCVTYQANGVMGFDTICVLVCDAQGFCDTSILIFGVQSLVDTVGLNVRANTEGTYCPDLSVFGSAIVSAVDLGCSTLDNGSINGINIANGCVRYQAGNIAGTDTVCLQVCDAQGFCDTTVIVFNVVPAPDTVRISFVPGNSAIDTCLYNIQFPGTLANVSNLGCDQNTVGTITVDLATGCVNYAPATPQPGSGTRIDTVCIVACDNSNPVAYCDTVIYIFSNIEPICGGAVPDVISTQVLDCNAVSVDVCLPIPLDSIGDYQVLIDGAPYGGNYGGCAFVTRIQYPFVLVPACGNDFIISWTINGQPFGPAQVTGVAGIVAQLNAWDTVTTWASTPNNAVIVGTNDGNDARIYGNLSVACLGGAGSPTLLGPTTQQQYADGAQIRLNAIGNYRLTVIDQFGCVDTSLIRIVCVQPSTVIDTVGLDSIDVLCTVDYSQIQTLDTVYIACLPQGNVQATLLGNGCVTVSGLALGVDSFCVVACDTFGICDTTYFQISVVLPTPIATTDVLVLPFGDSNLSFDFCTNDTIPAAPFSLTILQQPSLGSLSGSDCSWTYTRRSADVCGRDSFLYQVENASGRDTAWAYIDVECLPFSISGGISPNGDGLNDRFIINNLADYPDHELFIFNRWGVQVFRSKNYLNDWQGTFNGNPLPDGTYFYHLEMNNARNEVFNGFFILLR